MKTWRERIAEARERGYFIREDQEAWRHIRTCPAAEIVRANPLLAEDGEFYSRELHHMGNAFGDRGLLYRPGTAGEAECLLDAMEDRALQLKREHRDAF